MAGYTTSAVWLVLKGDPKSLEEQLDVHAGLMLLDPRKAQFLLLLAEGYTASYAMEKTGLRGNQTRLKRDILQELTEKINGEEDSANLDWADVR